MKKFLKYYTKSILLSYFVEAQTKDKILATHFNPFMTEADII